MNYPNDADGLALANIAASGMDMSKPVAIEFAIAVPDEAIGNKVCKLVSDKGFQSQLYYDEGEPDYIEGDSEEFASSWTVYVVIATQPTYDNVVLIQETINRLVSHLGGICDGWEVKLA